ncbi:ATP-binding protein [Pedococcus bigeumensis]|uniref:ATP-binding protein n=1 Tax=Pedococcus bigeumensis TaxID=433644 RepID=UPI0019D52C70|nr:LuxR family transcriptional regulator [Pedococcus bigeumensis]
MSGLRKPPSDAGAQPQSPESARTLVGRPGELETLWSFLADAANRAGSLLISGEPGVGKTALLGAAAARAEDLGYQVVRAGGAEFEVDVSFATLNQILGPFLGMMPQLEPEHWEALGAVISLGGGRVTDPPRVATATLALLRQAAANRPLLLVVDDLPWLDKASARVLAFVGRRVTGSPIAFVGAARTGEAGFFEEGDFPRLMVPPLQDAAADALLQRTFPALPGRVRQRILDEARGNPLALLELPAALGDLRQPHSYTHPDVLPVTERLQAVFAARVASLPPESSELLLLAALEGIGDLRVLTEADSQQEGQDSLEALGPAERARLVFVDPTTRRLQFRHPLTRSAVVGLATDGERRRAHTILASRLADNPERRAWHLAAAALGADEMVAALLEEVAQQAADRGDPVGAVAAFVRAADLSPARTNKFRRMARAAYLGANVTGDLGMAPQLLDESALEQDPDASLMMTLAAAAQLLNQDGALDTTYRLLVNAIDMHIGPFRADDVILGEVLHTLLLVCYFGGRPELWEPFDIAMARLDPEPPLDLRLVSGTLRDPARTAESVLDDLDTAIAKLNQQQDPAHIRRVGIAAVFVDRVGGCRQALWRVVEDGRAGGAITSSIDALFLLGNDDYLVGAWDEVDEVTSEGLRLCEELGYRMLEWPGRFLRALVAAARGDDATVQSMTERMAAWAFPRRVGSVQGYLAQVACQVALARGDYDAAYRHACSVSPAGELASHSTLPLWLILDLTEAAVRSGRSAEAAAHVAAVNQAGVRRLSPRLNLVTLGAAALAAPVQEATVRFDTALAAPDAQLFPFELARIQLAYGEHLRRTAHASAARTQLTQAKDIFDRLRARPWADRAARELRATGKAQLPPQGTPPLAQGVSATTLTPQQRQVAELAASGLTNKQIGERLFLSPRTVATHLYEIFPRLGITSRAALRDALASDDAVTKDGDGRS